jgi:hypothetical protein
MIIQQQEFEKIFRENLKVETYSKSIDSILSPRSRNKINYSPYYQRNYVWDNHKASYFIESILLGTEIPPLIFFNNDETIEVIDGRQRFETILRFVENKFALTSLGLTSLIQLKKKSYNDLDRYVIESFLETKLRITEFTIINSPTLDKHVEDKIKKEIFARYNSGITPLKKAEIENALYDDDQISNSFKQVLKADKRLQRLIYTTFFKEIEVFMEAPPLASLMDFIRRFLVLSKFPINYYARGTHRTEILTKLYEYLSGVTENDSVLIDDFIKKVRYVARVKENSVSKGYKYNRLVFECLIWTLSVLEMENIEYDYEDSELIDDLSEYFSDKIDEYDDQDYHFFKKIIDRYATTADFFKRKYKLDFDIYLYGSPQKREHIKEIQSQKDTITTLSELDTLRLNKPEPSRNSIEDVIRAMSRRKFLVRPSYQRQEVIKPSKSSLIIESILLGIPLPAIFIYKRANGISEVIDGQQRLLTILGFIDAEYIDENNNFTYSKNNRFSLRKLRILKELEGKRFQDLDDDLKNKIYNFQLNLVEIEENNNPKFQPIDLFIRLNNKPYPIREHSFEMWNSWADFEVVDKIRELTRKHSLWFFVKGFKNEKDRDRMENEELFTSLIFLEYSRNKLDRVKIFDIYQKSNRINARIGDKIYITNLLNEVAVNENVKKEFYEAVKRIESLVKKVKYIILDTDKTKDEVFKYIKNELDEVYLGGKEEKYFRRTFQDFYILWYLINDINSEMIRFYRVEIKKEIKKIFIYCKNIPAHELKDNQGYEKFRKKSLVFNTRYRRDERKLKLTEEDMQAKIYEQDHKSLISGAPIFLGDEIESDHIMPIAIGGKDDVLNIQITHKDENREKGVKFPIHSFESSDLDAEL